jgi:hypothetical protein
MITHQLRRLELLVTHLAAVLRRAPTPGPRKLQTAQDVIDLLEEQVEALRAEAGTRPVDKARAIGYVAGIALKAIETGALAARLDQLEASLQLPRPKPRL